MNDYQHAAHHARDLRASAERASLRHRVQEAQKWDRRARRALERARSAADKLR